MSSEGYLVAEILGKLFHQDFPMIGICIVLNRDRTSITSAYIYLFYLAAFGKKMDGIDPPLPPQSTVI